MVENSSSYRCCSQGLHTFHRIYKCMGGHTLHSEHRCMHPSHCMAVLYIPALHHKLFQCSQGGNHTYNFKTEKLTLQAIPNIIHILHQANIGLVAASAHKWNFLPAIRIHKNWSYLKWLPVSKNQLTVYLTLVDYIHELPVQVCCIIHPALSQVCRKSSNTRGGQLS